MSGGSYNYVSLSMQGGEVDGFLLWVDQLLDDLTRYRADAEKLTHVVTYTAERGADGKYKSVEHRVPRDAKHLQAFDAAIAQVTAAAALVAKAQAAVQALAPVAHEVEWRASGDTGTDQLIEALARWQEERAP